MENCGRTGKSTLQTVMPQISTDPPETARRRTFEAFCIGPPPELLQNRLSTSLRFPFAHLANKRRKVAQSPGFDNYRYHLPRGARENP